VDNSPNLFTIADLSYVWVLCDDTKISCPCVRSGQYTDVNLAAYPNLVLRGGLTSGRSDSPDPALPHHLKLRLNEEPRHAARVGAVCERHLPGQTRSSVHQCSDTAVLHLHDRGWVPIRQSERQKTSGAWKWQGGTMLSATWEIRGPA